MDLDIPDTSSDSSSDTIILSNKTPMNENAESELDNLLNKYLGNDYCPKSISTPPQIDLPSTTHEFSNVSKLKIPYVEEDGVFNFEKSTIVENQHSSPRSTSPISRIPLYDLDDLSDPELPSISQVKRFKSSVTKVDLLDSVDEQSGPYSKNKIDVGNQGKNCSSNSSKEQKKLEKEELRKQKLEDKERKKEEERKNKALKEALSSHYKNLKPDNCLKFIKAHIDIEITKKEFSEDIVEKLQSNSVTFIVESQLTSSIISWTRQIDSHILDINGGLINTSKGIQIEEILQIMDSIELLHHIHNQTFLTYIETLHSILNGKKIILAIYGLEKYYKFQRNKKNQNLAEEVIGKTYNTIKDKKIFENVPVVSRRTVEYALTEIQLLYSISHRMLETKSDIALFVFQLTKSIALIPYKLEKQQLFMQSKWFMSEDNKNCIIVDKNGNGLARLWKQIITTFPLASLETAEAISAVYPTPSSLFKAYESVSNVSDGEKLLQDIPIRRAAGPISTMRKIGPELSKKLYYLFSSFDSDKIL